MAMVNWPNISFENFKDKPMRAGTSWLLREDIVSTSKEQVDGSAPAG
jgi:hypothetical protein